MVSAKSRNSAKSGKCVLPKEYQGKIKEFE